jgi:outer membrane protein, heavy metal efflux system
MRARPSAFCLLVSAFAFISAEAQEITEREAIQKFLASTPLSRVARAQSNVTRAEWRSATLVSNPIFTASVEDSGGTRDQFLLVQQSLPITGRLGLLKQAGESAISATDARAKRRLDIVTADFRKLFLALGNAQQRETVLQQNVSRLTELVRILREREKAGEASGFDLIRAERELVDAQADTKLAHVQVEQSRSQLASYVPDLAAAAITAPIELGTMPTVTEAVTHALQQRADHRALRSELAQAEAQRRAAERLRVPEPTFTGGLKRTRFAGISDNGFVAGINIPLPFFNRGQADAARFNAEKDRVTAEQALLERQIEADVRASHAAANAGTELVNSYQPSSTTDLLRAADSAYQEGERGILELLDAYRLVRDADLKRLEILTTAKEAHIDLELAMGAEVQP